MEIQYDLFNNTLLDQLKEEIKVTATRSDNVRRGLFARHNELAKMYYSMQEENTQLKKDIHTIKLMLGLINQEQLDISMQLTA